MSGCNRTSIETIKADSVDIPVSIPGSYGRVAWFDRSRIAFIYKPTSAASYSDVRIFVYSTDKSQWDAFDIPTPTDCYAGWPEFPTRTPLGQLAIDFHCVLPEKPNSPPVKGIIYIWNNADNSYQRWQEYPVLTNPGGFSFTSDMTRVFIEQYGSEIYDAPDGVPPSRLPLGFYKESTPDVSPDGKRLAFAGIEQKPSGVGTPFSLDPEGFFEKWNLYKLDLQSNAATTLLTDIKYPNYVRWSPSGKFLAFNGNYQNQDGSYILNTQDLTVIRIWSDLGYADWSPDGTQLVISRLINPNSIDSETSQPVILSLPVNLVDK